MPAAVTRTWMSALFAGPFRSLFRQDLGPPPTVRVFGRRESQAACRVPLSRYGGFVALRAMYPARLLIHVRMPSAGITRIARPSSGVTAR